MANLAIRGHATRGREVIELLEMLGGINEDEHKGFMTSVYYFINDNYIDWCHECTPESEFICFSLEEFLEKFPYKVGDKVHNIIHNENQTITDLVWEEDEILYQTNNNEYIYVNYLQPYKEETMEEKLISKEEVSLKIDTSQMEKRQIIFSADAPNETELVLGDNFEIKVEDGKTFVVRKKPQYPKTYEGCCKITRSDPDFYIDTDLYSDKLGALYKLLICRDAYWKIAGNWKPDWKNGLNKCCITFCENRIIKSSLASANAILAFPTSEIRDTFYENFKVLIEECKEFL